MGQWQTGHRGPRGINVRVGAEEGRREEEEEGRAAGRQASVQADRGAVPGHIPRASCRQESAWR